MTKLPAPPGPDDLARIGAADVLELSVGTLLWRIYPSAGAQAGPWHGFRRFGPLHARFGPHRLPAGDDPERGVLYAATSVPTAITEVYQNTRRVDVGAAEPQLIGFALTTSVSVLDLTGGWRT